MAAAAIQRHRLIPVFLIVELKPEVTKFEANYTRLLPLIVLQVLNSFLEQATAGFGDGQQRLCVVTNANGVSFSSEPSMPPIETTVFPFIGFTEWQLIEAIDSQSKLRDAFVMLDEQTRNDGRTCRLVTHEQAHVFTVRSEFRDAQRSAVAILNESTNIQRLRNEAAMCGGSLKSDRALITHTMNQKISISFFNNSTTREPCCKPAQHHTMIPVFCTSDLPIEVC